MQKNKLDLARLYMRLQREDFMWGRVWNHSIHLADAEPAVAKKTRVAFALVPAMGCIVHCHYWWLKIHRCCKAAWLEDQLQDLEEEALHQICGEGFVDASQCASAALWPNGNWVGVMCNSSCAQSKLFGTFRKLQTPNLKMGLPSLEVPLSVKIQCQN